MSPLPPQAALPIAGVSPNPSPKEWPPAQAPQAQGLVICAGWARPSSSDEKPRLRERKLAVQSNSQWLRQEAGPTSPCSAFLVRSANRSSSHSPLSTERPALCLQLLRAQGCLLGTVFGDRRCQAARATGVSPVPWLRVTRVSRLPKLLQDAGSSQKALRGHLVLPCPLPLSQVNGKSGGETFLRPHSESSCFPYSYSLP